ncbi:uncharacterized protein N7459_004086 [Penicillium hispanicum]|uniref:uncharacterized protein n=1 Tax=Penicillium hispanicum TaxID=1080232 RepID=UPI002540C78F|nr:uncharacterized protein N7459_004086 [Penicillium hispanicum]KAJ5584286.1 hypothetical protein N7459_004086 [Penicillium hispanicum]
MSTPVLRLGILGATAAVESTFLPVIHSLPAHFSLTIIYDPNQDAAQRCQRRYNIAHSTAAADIVLAHPEVDLVLNLLPFEYHEPYTIAALEAGKHVMVEVPLSLSIQGLRRIHAATKKGLAARTTTTTTTASEPKVFIGCARRYAPCFTDVFKPEVARLDRIYYARCRNIAGPPSIPAPRPSADSTSAPDGVSAHDTPAGVNGVSSASRFHALLADVFGAEEDLTPDRVAFCRFLGNLGCHDLSVMREALGFPDAVASVAITDPFYLAIFHYTDDSVSGNGHQFTVLYEAGVDALPRCDASLTVYGPNRTVSIEYDFPCPGEVGCQKAVRVVVEEAEMEETSEGVADGNGDGVGVVRPRVKRTETVSSCEETYAREFLALHSYLVGGETTAKTTAADALIDLRLLHLIFAHYERQCGTIRTPLG